MNEKINAEPLASEMYKDLKEHDLFKKRLIKWLVIALVVSILGNIGQAIYHDWRWSMFDTVVVDSGESGNANYVEGDNVGGIFNGEGYSTKAQER